MIFNLEFLPIFIENFNSITNPKWPAKIKKGSLNGEVICTTDFFAPAAAVANYKLADNEGEDSLFTILLMVVSLSEKATGCYKFAQVLAAGAIQYLGSKLEAGLLCIQLYNI
ncbi:hypothetical protein ADIARSV_4155 [Arcticibacter svalbardensis MN12-7]|uniref:Uncharacterized protein n=1 Tax=Arcticibacter svalbardensis MN12-7 TaxID=1150600 RepID=R9GLS0_9SPHI|nr:hypothetical protein [Arcticibacter svalbardensis]EOR92643.1 hypothetical protein ADIARSV_4155 [Arcticibacter svalbardensis MN12-7]